jgi:hypothetical protein
MFNGSDDLYLSNLVGAIMGTPADVVKAHIMNQATDQFGRGLVYKSSADCAMQTIRGEGFLGWCILLMNRFYSASIDF